MLQERYASLESEAWALLTYAADLLKQMFMRTVLQHLSASRPATPSLSVSRWPQNFPMANHPNF